MRRFLLPLILAAASVAPVAAAGVEGVWAHDPEWCADPNRRIEITAEAIHGYENRCDILARDALEGLSALRLSTRCTGEGMEYDEIRLILLGGDRIWQWFGEQEPIIFHRCETGSF